MSKVKKIRMNELAKYYATQNANSILPVINRYRNQIEQAYLKLGIKIGSDWKTLLPVLELEIKEGLPASVDVAQSAKLKSVGTHYNNSIQLLDKVIELESRYPEYFAAIVFKGNEYVFDESIEDFILSNSTERLNSDLEISLHNYSMSLLEQVRNLYDIIGFGRGEMQALMNLVGLYEVNEKGEIEAAASPIQMTARILSKGNPDLIRAFIAKHYTDEGVEYSEEEMEVI